jgi:quercetin dioxygenase-like cupin family protein
MGFWNNISLLHLQDFRPGIRSAAESGDNLVMACMEIGQGREDTGHQHPFEQCGIVVTGKIEMFIGNEKRVLEEMETYFIPAGTVHGWKAIDTPVRLLDVSAKIGIQPGQS